MCKDPLSLVTAASALLSLAPFASSQAVLVESFETQASGSLQTRTGARYVDATNATGVNPAAGITEGVQAIEFLATGGAGFELVDIFDFAGVTRPVESITYDIYHEDLNPAGFFQFVAGFDFTDGDFQFAGGDYDQIDGVKLSDDPNGQIGNSFVGSGVGVNTIRFDATQNGGANAGVFGQLNTAITNGDPFDFALVLNKDSASTGIVRIDNVVVNQVPEPDFLFTSFEAGQQINDEGTGSVIDPNPLATDGTAALAGTFTDDPSNTTGNQFINIAGFDLNAREIDYTNATSVKLDFGFDGNQAGYAGLSAAIFFEDGIGEPDEDFFQLDADNAQASAFFVGDGNRTTDAEFILSPEAIAELLAGTAADPDARFRLEFFANTDPAASGTFTLDNIRIPGAVEAITEILGDYNDNGLVEQGDLNQVLNNWGVAFDQVAATWILQRPTEGIVDQAELNVVLNRWGSDAAPDFSGSAVPEPAGFLLLAGLSVAARRRRG